jgi:hypothetical protein
MEVVMQRSKLRINEMSEEKGTYAGNESSGITQEETVSPPGCDNLQWLPVIGVYPGGIAPVGETYLDGVIGRRPCG